jgi:hypothetical protein
MAPLCDLDQERDTGLDSSRDSYIVIWVALEFWKGYQGSATINFDILDVFLVLDRLLSALRVSWMQMK